MVQASRLYRSLEESKKEAEFQSYKGSQKLDADAQFRAYGEKKPLEGS